MPKYEQRRPLVLAVVPAGRVFGQDRKLAPRFTGPWPFDQRACHLHSLIKPQNVQYCNGTCPHERPDALSVGAFVTLGVVCAGFMLTVFTG